MSLRQAGRREAIKAQAVALFADRGVDAVSVADIAVACDMAKPNLYAHFASKDELVRELFQQGYRDYGQRMADAVAGTESFKVKLERLVRLICRLHDEDTRRFRFLLMTQHAHLHGIAIDERNPVEIVVRLVAAGMAAGEIPARDPALLAAGIVGIVVQSATFLLYGRIGTTLGAMADEIVAMTLRVAT